MLKKQLSYFVLFSILIYGIFKIWVLSVFSPIVKWVLKLLNFDIVKWESLFNSWTAHGDKVNEHALGWLLYYPSYFLLHILFISVLYRNNKKVNY